jgi:hypothetical protein
VRVNQEEVMTLAMADSAESLSLPAGLPAYASYVDGGIGDQPNYERVCAAHPGARHLSIALSAAHNADCLDVEPGAASPPDFPQWYARQLARGISRPVVYASVAAMREGILPMLAVHDIPRAMVRLWTAHYGQGEHVCGPKTCGELAVDADGTQWTDAYRTPGGVVDMSLLADGFFGPPADWVFGPVRGLVGTYGPHSLRLTWSSPGQPAPEAVHHYQVTVRLKGRDIRGFPVTVPKTAVQESIQWNGVEQGTYDEAMVRAVAVDGHASPWSTVRFAR